MLLKILGLLIGFAAGFLTHAIYSIFSSSRSASETLKIVPLGSSAGFERDPSFSPDGRDIVYVWGSGPGTGSIYRKRIGSNSVIRLTSDSDGEVQSPAWTSDALNIVYIRPLADKAEIWEVSSLGGQPRKLGETFLYPGHLNRHPGLSSSPDGLYLAIPNNGSPGEHVGIFLFSLKTGAWRRLTTATYGENQPSFSPDGQQIAFVRANSLGVEDLHVVSVVGGEPRRLTSDDKTINGITWTPDGRELVFASNRGGVLVFGEYRHPAAQHGA